MFPSDLKRTAKENMKTSSAAAIYDVSKATKSAAPGPVASSRDTSASPAFSLRDQGTTSPSRRRSSYDSSGHDQPGIGLEKSNYHARYSITPKNSRYAQAESLDNSLPLFELDDSNSDTNPFDIEQMVAGQPLKELVHFAQKSVVHNNEQTVSFLPFIAASLETFGPYFTKDLKRILKQAKLTHLVEMKLLYSLLPSYEIYEKLWTVKLELLIRAQENRREAIILQVEAADGRITAANITVNDAKLIVTQIRARLDSFNASILAEERAETAQDIDDRNSILSLSIKASNDHMVAESQLELLHNGQDAKMSAIAQIHHNLHQYGKELADGIRNQMAIDAESLANALAVSNIIVKLIQSVVNPTHRVDVYQVISRLIPYNGTTQDPYEAGNLIGMMDNLQKEFDKTSTLLDKLIRVLKALQFTELAECKTLVGLKRAGLICINIITIELKILNFNTQQWVAILMILTLAKEYISKLLDYLETEQRFTTMSGSTAGSINGDLTNGGLLDLVLAFIDKETTHTTLEKSLKDVQGKREFKQKVSTINVNNQQRQRQESQVMSIADGDVYAFTPQPRREVSATVAKQGQGGNSNKPRPTNNGKPVPSFNNGGGKTSASSSSVTFAKGQSSKSPQQYTDTRKKSPEGKFYASRPDQLQDINKCLICLNNYNHSSCSMGKDCAYSHLPPVNAATATNVKWNKTTPPVSSGASGKSVNFVVVLPIISVVAPVTPVTQMGTTSAASQSIISHNNSNFSPSSNLGNSSTVTTSIGSASSPLPLLASASVAQSPSADILTVGVAMKMYFANQVNELLTESIDPMLLGHVAEFNEWLRRQSITASAIHYSQFLERQSSRAYRARIAEVHLNNSGSQRVPVLQLSAKLSPRHHAAVSMSSREEPAAIAAAAVAARIHCTSTYIDQTPALSSMTSSTMYSDTNQTLTCNLPAVCEHSFADDDDGFYEDTASMPKHLAIWTSGVKLTQEGSVANDEDLEFFECSAPDDHIDSLFEWNPANPSCLLNIFVDVINSLVQKYGNIHKDMVLTQEEESMLDSYYNDIESSPACVRSEIADFFLIEYSKYPCSISNHFPHLIGSRRLELILSYLYHKFRKHIHDRGLEFFLSGPIQFFESDEETPIFAYAILRDIYCRVEFELMAEVNEVWPEQYSSDFFAKPFGDYLYHAYNSLQFNNKFHPASYFDHDYNPDDEVNRDATHVYEWELEDSMYKDRTEHNLFAQTVSLGGVNNLGITANDTAAISSSSTATILSIPIINSNTLSATNAVSMVGESIASNTGIDNPMFSGIYQPSCRSISGIENPTLGSNCSISGIENPTIESNTFDTGIDPLVPTCTAFSNTSGNSQANSASEYMTVPSDPAMVTSIRRSPRLQQSASVQFSPVLPTRVLRSSVHSNSRNVLMPILPAEPFEYDQPNAEGVDVNLQGATISDLGKRQSTFNRLFTNAQRQHSNLVAQHDMELQAVGDLGVAQMILRIRTTALGEHRILYPLQTEYNTQRRGIHTRAVQQAKLIMQRALMNLNQLRSYTVLYEAEFVITLRHLEDILTRIRPLPRKVTEDSAPRRNGNDDDDNDDPPLPPGQRSISRSHRSSAGVCTDIQQSMHSQSTDQQSQSGGTSSTGKRKRSKFDKWKLRTLMQELAKSISFIQHYDFGVLRNCNIPMQPFSGIEVSNVALRIQQESINIIQQTITYNAAMYVCMCQYIPPTVRDDSDPANRVYHTIITYPRVNLNNSAFSSIADLSFNATSAITSELSTSTNVFQSSESIFGDSDHVVYSIFTTPDTSVNECVAIQPHVTNSPDIILSPLVTLTQIAGSEEFSVKPWSFHIVNIWIRMYDESCRQLLEVEHIYNEISHYRKIFMSYYFCRHLTRDIARKCDYFVLVMAKAESGLNSAVERVWTAKTNVIRSAAEIFHTADFSAQERPVYVHVDYLVSISDLAVVVMQLRRKQLRLMLKEVHSFVVKITDDLANYSYYSDNASNSTVSFFGEDSIISGLSMYKEMVKYQKDKRKYLFGPIIQPAVSTRNNSVLYHMSSHLDRDNNDNNDYVPVVIDMTIDSDIDTDSEDFSDMPELVDMTDDQLSNENVIIESGLWATAMITELAMIIGSDTVFPLQLQNDKVVVATNVPCVTGIPLISVVSSISSSHSEQQINYGSCVSTASSQNDILTAVVDIPLSVQFNYNDQYNYTSASLPQQSSVSTVPVVSEEVIVLSTIGASTSQVNFSSVTDCNLGTANIDTTPTNAPVYGSTAGNLYFGLHNTHDDDSDDMPDMCNVDSDSDDDDDMPNMCALDDEFVPQQVVPRFSRIPLATTLDTIQQHLNNVRYNSPREFVNAQPSIVQGSTDFVLRDLHTGASIEIRTLSGVALFKRIVCIDDSFLHQVYSSSSSIDHHSTVQSDIVQDIPTTIATSTLDDTLVLMPTLDESAYSFIMSQPLCCQNLWDSGASVTCCGDSRCFDPMTSELLAFPLTVSGVGGKQRITQTGFHHGYKRRMHLIEKMGELTVTSVGEATKPDSDGFETVFLFGSSSAQRFQLRDKHIKSLLSEFLYNAYPYLVDTAYQHNNIYIQSLEGDRMDDMTAHVNENSTLGAMAASAAYMEVLNASVATSHATTVSTTHPIIHESMSISTSIPVTISNTIPQSRISFADGVGSGSTTDSLFQIRGVNRHA